LRRLKAVNGRNSTASALPLEIDVDE
jgi:hypothetical protein